jgi:hypothetical protein
MISETTNNTINMKKTILAISTAATAIPVKPSTPAIRAMTKNVSTQPNISILLLMLYTDSISLMVV